LKKICAAIVTVAFAACANPEADGRSPATEIAAITLKNADFEQPGGLNNVPGWTLSQHAGPPSFEMGLDSDKPFAGHASFRIRRTHPQIYGSITQQVDVAAYAGKTVEFSAMTRTVDIGPDGWVLFLDIPGERVSAKPATGTKGWYAVKLRKALPAGTKSVTIGALLFDDGTAWLDNVSMRIVE